MMCKARKLILTTTVFAAIAAPMAVHSADLIGLTIPPAPAGLVHDQGACVAHARGIDRACNYSIGILEDAAGKPSVLFGGRLAGYADAKKAKWTITDTMPFPALPAGYELAVASCRVGDIDDRTIFAAVRLRDEEWLREVLWAYRYDLKSEKFVKQDPAGVMCANEAWGL